MLKNPKKMSAWASLFVSALLCSGSLADPSFGYEVAEVKNGGILTGVVTLLGPPPDPKAYNLVTFPDPEYCGRISTGNGWRLLRDFLVNDQRQVKDVVVFLKRSKQESRFLCPYLVWRPAIVSSFHLPLLCEVGMESK